MNARNARFLVATLAAVVMLSGAAAILRPFDAFAGSAMTPPTPPAPVVSRREFLARLVAETAARAAEDAARRSSMLATTDDRSGAPNEPKP